MNVNKIWPLLIIGWLTFNFGRALALHGKPVRERCRVVVIARLFFGILIWITILHFAGFFNVIQWPQITWTILTIMIFGLVVSSPPPQKNVHNFWSVLTGIVIFIWLFYKGGAFQYLTNG